MLEKDNYTKSAELAADQHYNSINSMLNTAPPAPVPVPDIKPLDKVREREER